jgi:hypothetical protein
MPLNIFISPGSVKNSAAAAVPKIEIPAAVITG